MSNETLHSLVVRFNRLPEGLPEKASLGKLIAQEMKNNASKQATAFSLA